MKGGEATVDASMTSQFLSGLLMALPLCARDSRLAVTHLASAPYVRMTLQLVASFGVLIECDDRLETFAIRGSQAYTPRAYVVEGDWSGASFPLVAGAIAGSVTVTNLDASSLQADRAILGVLADAGARVETGSGRVSVGAGPLRAFRFDATSCPDLFPPLVALASACEGTSVIHGVERLFHKESDRARALCEEFAKLGIAIGVAGNVMEIRGGAVRGARVDSHNDHRIAMACAVAGLRASGEVAIDGEACVAKSYPAFFSDIARLQQVTAS